MRLKLNTFGSRPIQLHHRLISQHLLHLHRHHLMSAFAILMIPQGGEEKKVVFLKLALTFYDIFLCMLNFILSFSSVTMDNFLQVFDNLVNFFYLALLRFGLILCYECHAFNYDYIMCLAYRSIQSCVNLIP